MGEFEVKVLVYDDVGTSNVDVLSMAIHAALIKLINSPMHHIVRVNATDVNDGSCFNNATVLFVPGGRDLPYIEKLLGSGISNIKKFVENGGKYFGICAGAYFASSFCEFERGTDLEVCGSRELQLYRGKTKGCLYPGFKYGTENGARIVNINLCYASSSCVNNGKYPVYYNGGCEFIPFDDMDGQQVVNCATYEDFPDKVAIVLCTYGKGKVLLSGVHPEMNYKFLSDESKHNKEQLKILSAISENQQQLFEILISWLLK